MNSVHMIKKAKVVVLILCLLLTVTGCEKNDSSNRGYASSDEAKIEFEKMCVNLMEYAKNADGEKVDKLVKCYPEDWDECTVMSIFNDYNINGYSDYLYYVIPLDDKGEYYLGGIINSSTKDGQVEQNSYLLTISFLDGCCKIDCCDKAAELASKVNIYPDGMKDAESNGKLSERMSESDLSFAVLDAVIANAYKAIIYCMWQNEDDSLSIGVSFKNGTEIEKSVGDIYITVVALDGTGTILEGYEEHINKSVEVNSTTNIIVNIPADSLKKEIDLEKQYAVFIQHSQE